MTDLSEFTQFKVEPRDGGIVHLIFDAPGRSMNVFSEQAIREIDAFAAWLATSDALGVVLRSGKPSAFCVGADLSELAQAYDMIMAAPAGQQAELARAHFSRLGSAFRKLETAGKPVVAAVDGLALGGGCELALACHHRVLTDRRETALGLPESLVGLLPGAGGTQRMPRLVGIGAALPVLLEGERFSAAKSIEVGAADEVVAPGKEIAAAESWIHGNPEALQPWDADDWKGFDEAEVAQILEPVRRRILADGGGHYPAPLAILDCLTGGLSAAIDDGLAEENRIFGELVRRVESRNMIQTQFVGRVEYEKRKRNNALPAWLDAFLREIRTIVAENLSPEARATYGFRDDRRAAAVDPDAAARMAARPETWFDAPNDAVEAAARATVARAAAVAARHQASEQERLLADYATVLHAGFPGYLGGPFTVLDRLGAEECFRLSRA